MISSLRGRLEAIGSDWAIVDVNGVGYHVFLPTSALSTLGPIGSEVRLYTRLLLRDENLVLYGFATIEEMGLFETLTSVSGIGPKLGLALLSAMKAEQLASAIASSDVDLLTTVPGVGKKTAARIVLELKDKIAASIVLAPAQVARESADVLAALASLGYSPAEASRAVAALPPGDLTLEEKVRQALGYFARR